MKDKLLHSFSFRTEGIGTRIIMDGEQLRGVYNADISFAVNKLPLVTLQFLSNDISVNIKAIAEELGGAT